MNSVSLVGRITKDIELRYTESGIACVSLTIAINNGKDQEGNERPADFPRIYVYDRQAENVKEYCHKGSLIAVSGRLKTRSWDKEDGTKGYETYVRANNIQFLDSKSSNSGVPLPEPEFASTEVKEETTDAFQDFAETVEISSEDLPF